VVIPDKKSKRMEEFLDNISDRTKNINLDVCVPPPIGCGGPATGFRDESSRREYRISGLCQKCQDELFGEY